MNSAQRIEQEMKNCAGDENQYDQKIELFHERFEGIENLAEKIEIMQDYLEHAITNIGVL